MRYFAIGILILQAWSVYGQHTTTKTDTSTSPDSSAIIQDTTSAWGDYSSDYDTSGWSIGLDDASFSDDFDTSGFDFGSDTSSLGWDIGEFGGGGGGTETGISIGNQWMGASGPKATPISGYSTKGTNRKAQQLAEQYITTLQEFGLDSTMHWLQQHAHSDLLSSEQLTQDLKHDHLQITDAEILGFRPGGQSNAKTPTAPGDYPHYQLRLFVVIKNTQETHLGEIKFAVDPNQESVEIITLGKL